MTSQAAPGALIDLASVPNLRDLGGYTTGDGRTVRRGLLYRSTELSNVSGSDEATLAGFGLHTVFDLRTEAEQRSQPDLLPDGVTLIPCDVMADATGAAPAQLEEVLADPATATSLLADGQGAAYMIDAYRQFVTMPSALTAYRRLFSSLLEPGTLPALFHCATGKDRTGWATAALFLLLGVPDEAVRAEYLLTNDHLLPALRPVFDLFAATGGNAELLRPLLGVDASYLDAALDEMRARYGTVQSYFADGLGLDAAAQEQLKALLLE
jgi:protein-tyrosine phosphatase